MAERTWIEIDGRALTANVRALADLVFPAELMPMVKANAYGHGLENVAQLARKWPVWGLGVAYGSEALQLRKLNYRGKIAVLSAWRSEELLTLAKKRVDIVVHDFVTLKRARSLAKRGTRVNIQIKLDTGTTRIGFLNLDIERLKKVLARRPKKLVVSGIWSHFSSSENSTAITKAQLTRFVTMVDRLGISAPLHIACTASAIQFPDTRLDLARAGLGIYGYWPSAATKVKSGRLRLRPALRWYTTVLQIKKVPRGTVIGYNQTFCTQRASTVAVLPVGYADGLRRELSNRGRVQIRNTTWPIVGRVSMNLCMIDITGAKNVQVGTPVRLLGDRVTADDHATWDGTISYDILAGLSPLIPRFTV